MSLVPYQYVVLRCVPRVEREEFVNVGIALYAQRADYLACASAIDEARLRAMAPDLDLAAVAAALIRIEDVCAGRTGDGRPTLASLGQRFGWITAPRSTVIQPGPVHGGLTTDPGRCLQDLLDRLVR